MITILKRKSDMPVEYDKKEREVATLDTKLDIIKRFYNGQSKASKAILIEELEKTFRSLETVKQQIMDLDPKLERSMPVRRTLENGISCYRKMYEEKKKATLFKRPLTNIFLESSICFSLVL
jgi:ASC-1-like (ASCH) protein